MDDTVNTLDIVTKKAGANVKQQKRHGQTDRYWFDEQCKKGKEISHFSKKEH